MTLPTISIIGSESIMPPLGLQYIASNLYGSNAIYVLDQALRGFNLAPLYLDEEHNIKIIGVQGQEIVNVIKEKEIEFLGVSCNFSYQHNYLIETLEMIKIECPNVKVVVGGNHVTAYHKANPKMKNIDYYISGEGELAFNHILRGTYKEGEVYQIENPDKINFPLRTDMEEYLKINQPHDQATTKGARVANMITSRGCPYNCLFCSVKNIWGRKFRPRSPENVLAEVDELVNKHQITEIHFEDDNLLADKKRMIEICKGLRKYKLKWTCPNGMDMSKLDEELIEEMIASGLYRITICPESYNDRILKFLRKHFNTKMIDEKVALIRKYPIELVGYFIVGAPMETYQEAWNTLKFASKFDSYDVSFLAPYPGTDFYAYCLEKDLLINRDDYSVIQADVCCIKLENMDASNLAQMIIFANQVRSFGVKL